jgi:DNA-binding transcriptional MerR regulator
VNEPPIGFTIKVVAERTDVSVHTLRAWERRYGVPKPSRGAANRYRLYGEDDIADVLWLKQQVEAGIPPAQASVLLRQRREQPRAVARMEGTQHIARVQAVLFDAFAQSDEVAAQRILDEAFALFAPDQVARQIIEPTMQEIGARWMRNEMTVWQEHLASDVVRRKLYAVLRSEPIQAMGAPALVAACAPNEEHALGLLVFSLLAQREGWRVIFLGQGTPLDSLNDVARASRSGIVAVAVTTVTGLVGLVPWLDATKRPHTKLVFGGRLVDTLASLREHLPGEYLGVDVAAAARNLVALKPRAEYWSPSKRVWNATDALRAQRLKLAGDTVARFLATLPANLQRRWDIADLNHATLFLIDALSCALAFAVPELMDAERAWLKEAMPPRVLTPELMEKYIETFARALTKSFPQEQNHLYQPLVARMRETR